MSVEVPSNSFLFISAEWTVFGVSAPLKCSADGASWCLRRGLQSQDAGGLLSLFASGGSCSVLCPSLQDGLRGTVANTVRHEGPHGDVGIVHSRACDQQQWQRQHGCGKGVPWSPDCNGQIRAGGGRERAGRIWGGGSGGWRREERDLESRESGWGRWEERGRGSRGP